MEANLKASELRIGNYVKDDEGNIVIVERINSNNIHEFTMVSKNGKIYPSNIYPIPLTEEIFSKKCGFKRQGKRNFYVNGNIGIVINHGFEIWIKDASNVFYRYNLKIDYLHQLQNIWYYLNNFEELEINSLN